VAGVGGFLARLGGLFANPGGLLARGGGLLANPGGFRENPGGDLEVSSDREFSPGGQPERVFQLTAAGLAGTSD
jgi:hypothetical protein